MYLSGAGTGMAAVAAIPAVQRILQDRLPAVAAAVAGLFVAAVGSTAPLTVPSRTGAAAAPTPGAATAASASSDLSGNLLWLPLQPGFA